MSHFIKIHPVEAELFHADEWMDRQTHTQMLQHCFLIQDIPEKTVQSKD